MDLEGLVDEATLERLRLASSGQSQEVRLTIAGLAPGTYGVLEARVRMVHPARTYRRRDGGEGLLQKVTLADATGEAVLVLWDQETRHARETLLPGARVRLRGATVQAAWQRGGQSRLTPPSLELTLGAAVLERIDAPAPPAALEGTLLMVGEADVVGAKGETRIRAEALLATGDGEAHVLLSDQQILAARRLVGSRVRIEGARPNPGLDGWWIAPPSATVTATTVTATPA